MESLEVRTIMVLIGLGLGIVYGSVAHRTQFCVRRGVYDLAIGKGFSSFTGWLAALGIAIIGTQWLVQTEMLLLTQTNYVPEQFGIISLLFGATIFGVGMMLTRGCPARLLVLAATGNLRALFGVLIIGLSSYATFKGILAVPRLWFQSFMPISFPQESLINLLPESFQLVVAIILGLFIVILAIKMRWSALTFGGLIVGVLVVVAWWLTLHFGADDFDPMPPASFSFVVPTAEGLVYIMLASGVAPTFATALVGGTMLGAFGSAVLGKTFTWQSFAHTKDHVRYFLGSVLMGVGGVLALGCTTGQAITGMGTLSPWSLLATITMLLSGYLTQRWFLGQNDQKW